MHPRLIQTIKQTTRGCSKFGKQKLNISEQVYKLFNTILEYGQCQICIITQIHLAKTPKSDKSEVGNQLTKYIQSNSIRCLKVELWYQYYIIQKHFLLFNTHSFSKARISAGNRYNLKHHSATTTTNWSQQQDDTKYDLVYTEVSTI